MASLTDGLNFEQAIAVLSESKRILMLAGAGTGKTRTLTHRIAHLNLNCRVGTSSIVAITFTRASAKEMKERLIPLIGNDAKKLICCTFHALAVRILQEWGHRLGLNKQFTIYSQEDREEIIKSIIQEAEYKTTHGKMMREKWKFSPNSQEQKVWNEYQYRLRRYNAIDLDFLIPKVNELFKANPDVALSYRKYWKYVFVDEFQDTDREQLENIKQINPDNLFVIGDDFQSIYGFRGARVENILQFPDEFEGTEVIKLEQNYRSTRQIVEAANNLISYNVNQTEKKLVAHREGNPLEVITVYDEENQHAYVVNAIRSKSDDQKYSDFAILGRTNAQIDAMTAALRRENIPCMVLSSSNDPMKKQDIKSLISYLDCIFNPRDEINFKRVLMFPEPVMTDLQFQQMEQIAIDHSITLREALMYSEVEQVKAFYHSFNDLMNNVHFMAPAVEALKELIHYLKLVDFYEERKLGNRQQDLDNAIQYVGFWCERQDKLGESNTAMDFLKWLRIRDIQEKLMDKRDCVKIMTIHGSKGLEFPSVYIIGMNKGSFPSRNTQDMEEERRLAFVAVTRAMNELTLINTKTATNWGKTELVEPSQFIREINQRGVSS